jgi:hypothetical protein
MVSVERSRKKGSSRAPISFIQAGDVCFCRSILDYVLPIGAPKTQSIRNDPVTFSDYYEGDEQALAREPPSRSYEQKRAKFAGPGAEHFW